MEFPSSSELAKVLFSLAITLLVAIITNHILRSLIRVPHNFDTRRSRTYVTILRNCITVVVYAVALYVMLAELGVNITPLLASAGIIGLVLGLGAKTLIEDVIAGLFLLSQDSIAIGDAVKIDDAEGSIEKISVRTLTVRTEDGALHIIPNGQIKKVINFSQNKSSLQIDIPVKADQQIETILKAVNEALDQIQKDADISDALYPGSSVEGIDDFKPAGPMIVRVTLLTYPERRREVARTFRFFVKKSFEKHKVHLG